VIRLESGDVRQPVNAEQVRRELERHKVDVVTMVHGETSCGVKTIELPEICRLARNHGALTIVDAVVTLSAMPMPMDDWAIDVCFTAGQKALSSIPGVSLCAFSPNAWRAVETHPAQRPHWCYDAVRAQKFWGEHQYHYTAPTSGILALHEALRLVTEETLERRFARHKFCSEAMQAALEAMGLELFIPQSVRLNSVLAVAVPDGADSARVRDRMTTQFGVEISGAFGLNIVRIGQMGEQCRPANLLRTLEALGRSLVAEGVSLDVDAGMATLAGKLAAGV
ncbi:MAG TPA: aminotransferase class V-fold PLP-dependent enzyme, partial [Vicinamibacterales bacterium]|nr:aminotransferase class V-fold PLP-dependent enzyme [Vicinamibacterales bacterium]